MTLQRFGRLELREPNQTNSPGKENRMRTIASWLFITLDGVVEAPETWVIYNEQMGEAIDQQARHADTLLLGRKTYEVFAGSWPERTVDDDPLADWMNTVEKVVVSASLDETNWQNSRVVSGDLDDVIADLKSRPGKGVLINGSPSLVTSLLQRGLLDELRLFVVPVLTNSGARLFARGETPVSLEVIGSQTFDNGVQLLTYRPKPEGQQSR